MELQSLCNRTGMLSSQSRVKRGPVTPLIYTAAGLVRTSGWIISTIFLRIIGSTSRMDNEPISQPTPGLNGLVKILAGVA